MKVVTGAEVKETVRTPLGAVSVRVEAASSVVMEVLSTPAPVLPKGMAVDGVKLVRIRIETEVTHDHPLRLHVTAEHSADPEGGECLESVAFRSGAGTCHVAVRDNGWLEGRGIVADHVNYEPHGLCQTVKAAPVGALLWVSVAWRCGDRASTDVSTWFAADLALPVAQTP